MKGAGMRVIGLDIHRAFAEAVSLEDSKLKRLGRVSMRRDPLEKFAAALAKDDVVVVEATGNAAAVAAVIGPYVKRVVIANPKQVRIIAHAKIKTDTIDAGALAQLYASGFLPEVWIAGPAPADHPPQSDRASTFPSEEHHPIDLACAPDPRLSSSGSVWAKGPSLACRTNRSRGRASRHRAAFA
jgi:hypothetical protein